VLQSLLVTGGLRGVKDLRGWGHGNGLWRSGTETFSRRACRLYEILFWLRGVSIGPGHAVGGLYGVRKPLAALPGVRNKRLTMALAIFANTAACLGNSAGGAFYKVVAAPVPVGKCRLSAFVLIRGP
jgi:hypothetical protein